ncbi:cytochrome P450 [Flagelloscypha sp. PMI_526]|nr:cytochrome P450 [Flagelloscypha sp. PMI_526]
MTVSGAVTWSTVGWTIALLVALPALPLLKPNLGLRHIPTAGCGSQSWFASWKGAIRFITDGKGMVAEGYREFPGRAFKIPTLTGWMVVLTTEDHIEDIRRAREQLSFVAGVAELLHTDYTISPLASKPNGSVEIVRSPLTRHINTAYPEIHDELITTFNQFAPSHDLQEWEPTTLVNLCLNLSARGTHRMLVGLPICRDPEYLELNISFTATVFNMTAAMTAIPGFLRPYAAQWMNVRSQIQKVKKFIGNRFLDRLAKQRDGSLEEDMTKDLPTWLVAYAQDDSELQLDALMVRFMQLNLASIHSIANVMADAMLDLTAHQEYLPALRQEIEDILGKDGWTKNNIARLAKMDSFLMESMRTSGSAIQLLRKVMTDFTFSDGTTVPRGNLICFAAVSAHQSNEVYPDADTFNGLRFYQEDGTTKPSITTPGYHWLVFGHGSHACPGRFLAMTLIKTALAHLIREFDIKFPEGTSRPASTVVGGSPSPSRTAQILWKRRVKGDVM